MEKAAQGAATAAAFGLAAWSLAAAEFIPAVVLLLALAAHRARWIAQTLFGLQVLWAIRRGHLHLCYQPQVGLDSGRLLAVEALVRWSHPRRGAIGPSEFVPRIEGTSAARRLDSFVLDTAARQARALELAGRPVPVAVNLSASTFEDDALVDRILGVIESHGLPPSLLCVEITESALEGTANAAAVLQRLGEAGVAVALDDFGVGYSALQRLVRLPLASLKIDRSFVTDMATNERAAVVVYSAVELAHALNLTVVAEGVETEYLMARLRALGVDLAQGYLIARPLAADALARWQAEADRACLERRSGGDRRKRLEVRGAMRERRSWADRRSVERPLATVAPV